MKIEVFTGGAPEFKPLAVVEMHCPACGKLMRTPAEMLVDRVADKIKEYYRERIMYLEKENAKLKDILQFGNQIRLIQDTASKISP